MNLMWAIGGFSRFFLFLDIKLGLILVISNGFFGAHNGQTRLHSSAGHVPKVFDLVADLGEKG